MSEVLVRDIEALLGAGSVRSSDAVAQLDPGWHAANLAAGLVAMPASTSDVSKLLGWCNARGIGVVPQGGRTGLAGGGASLPGQVILSLARMDRIESVEPVGSVATVEAGVTLERLQAEAAAHGLDPGIDLASRGSATIGGMISTNAGGIRAFRSGVMRHRVLGLEAVFADGSVLGDLTTVMKASAGYDVKQLVVGSEGTLAVATRASLRLEPLAGPRATALLGLAGPDGGLRVLRHFRDFEPGVTLLAAEFMTGGFAVGSAAANGIDPSSLRLGPAFNLILEVGSTTEGEARAALEDRLSAIWQEAAIVEAVIAASLAQRDAIWRIREASDAMARSFPLELWYDVSVPLLHFGRYLEALPVRLGAIDGRLESHAVGHLADGNLHVMVACRTPFGRIPHTAIEAAVCGGLTACGGSFSAEHGIGIEKLHAMARYADPGKLALMRRLKNVLDPNGIMNPGKLLPPL